MPHNFNYRLLSNFRTGARQIALLVACLGAASLLARLLHALGPEADLSPAPTLGCEAGLGLLFGGVSLAASLSERPRWRGVGLAAALALVATALAGLLPDTAGSARYTHVSLLLVGFALLSSWLPRRLRILTHGSALAAGYVSLLGIVSLVYLHATGGGDSFGLAAATCWAAQASLAAAIAAAWLEGGPLEVIASRTAGGFMARQMIVPILILMPFIGWLRLQAQEAGLFGTEIGLALMVTLAIAALLLLVFRNARALAHLDAEQRETAESLETTLLCIGDGVISTDTSGRVTCMNKVAEKLTGWPIEEARGKPMCEVFQILNEHTGVPVESPVARVLEDGVIVGLANHTCLVSRSGIVRPIADSGAPIRDFAGELQGVVVVFRDMTEERDFERALRASQEDLETTLRSIGEAVIAVDAMGRVTRMNAVAEALTGWPFEEAAGKPYEQVVRVVDAPRSARLENLVPQVLAEKAVRVFHQDLELLSRNGDTVPIALNVAPILSGSGDARGCVLILRDVLQEREAQSRLLRSQREFLDMVERSPSWILIFRGGQIAYANRAALQALGYPSLEELERLKLLDLVVPEEREAAALRAASLESGEDLPFPLEYRVLRRDGSEGRVEVNGAERVYFDGEPGWLAVGTEITGRKKLEAQLVMADRMASLGVLAAGVAHEINNPLSYVIANLESASRRADQDLSGSAEAGESLLAALAEALDGAARVRSIVRSLGAFSRVEGGAQERVELLPVLESACKIARRQIEAKGTFIVDVSELPPVVGDPTRLGQVFLNLLVNAADALTAPPSTGTVRLTAWTSADGGAVVEVADTGAGIPAPLLQKIFEPFFTTKPVGVGTGLGLAICHSIVSSHGGSLEVESEVGRGSSFRVKLPAAPGEATAPPDPGVSRRPRVSSQPRILVIDDEERIARSIQRLLQGICEVEFETSADRALARLKAGQHFDGILCDLIMPGMTGMDFHSELGKLSPDLAERIVFLTGGAFTDQARRFYLEVRDRCLEKPFTEAELVAVVDRWRT